MKINLYLAARDCGDGSITINLVNTKEEALSKLGRTEDELEMGCFYEDGLLDEVELEIDGHGKLIKPFSINIE